MNKTKSPIPLWKLCFSWDKGTFSPGKQISGSLLVQNISDMPIFIRTARLRFDWSSNISITTQIHIPPDSQSSILLPPIKILHNITGKKKLQCSLETFVYKNKTQKWVNYRFVRRKGPIILFIKPEPVYKVFISRSNWEQDKPLIEPIVKRISEWGFNCSTVGISVKAKNPNKPTPEITREITNADCLIAIATPRDLLVKYGQWTAPDWLHGEVGIGFGKEKPILVIYEESVRLSGLPQQFYKISFSMQNVTQLMYKIDAVMPYVREWIKNKKWDALWKNVFKIVTGGFIGYGIYKAGVEEGRGKI